MAKEKKGKDVAESPQKSYAIGEALTAQSERQEEIKSLASVFSKAAAMFEEPIVIQDYAIKDGGVSIVVSTPTAIKKIFVSN